VNERYARYTFKSPLLFQEKLNWEEPLIILITHKDGGIGKTSLAVHITGVLLSRFPKRKTLLLDCDKQHQSWDFFTQARPSYSGDFWQDGNLSVIYNKYRHPISEFLDLDEIDYTVIDIDTPCESTSRVMIDNEPDVVLIPLNKTRKSLGNLAVSLSMISAFERKMGFSPVVIIVPVGISKARIEKRLNEIYDGPINKIFIGQRIRDVEAQMQVAIYEDFRYIWNYEGYEDLYDKFYSVISSVISFVQS
jgi:chromosome partitioning protein